MFHSHHTSKTWPKPTSVPCENKKISTKSVEAYICSYSKLYMSVGVVWYQPTSSVYFYFLLFKILSWPFGLWFLIDKIFTHDRIDSEIILVFKVGISITANKTGTFPHTRPTQRTMILSIISSKL